MSITHLARTLHIICRDRGSNPGTPTYSPYKVKFQPLPKNNKIFTFNVSRETKVDICTQRQHLNAFIYFEISMPPFYCYIFQHKHLEAPKWVKILKYTTIFLLHGIKETENMARNLNVTKKL
jgi:hypothetical protein